MTIWTEFDTTYPDATSTKTRYDSLGKVVESTDQRQRSTLFHYDDLGRLERTEYEDETTARHESNAVSVVYMGSRY